MKKLKLRCPFCGFETLTNANKDDPPGTVSIELECIECGSGTFAGQVFLDANGKELEPASYNTGVSRER